MSKHFLSEDDSFGDESFADTQPPPKKKPRNNRQHGTAVEKSNIVNNDDDHDQNKTDLSDNSQSWNCAVCTFTNNNIHSQCVICDNVRPKTNVNINKEENVANTAPTTTYHENKDNNDQEEKQDEKEAKKDIVCPKCKGKNVIIIERDTCMAPVIADSYASSNCNDKITSSKVRSNSNQVFHECLKCSVTFCVQCQTIPFHFNYPTCEEYKDYEQALKLQFEMDGINALNSRDNKDIMDINAMLCFDTIMDKCFLISNIFTIEQQIELYDQILSASKDLSNHVKHRGTNSAHVPMRLLFGQWHMHYASNDIYVSQKQQVNVHYRFAKYVDNVVKIIRKLQQTDKSFCAGFPTKYQCNYVSALEYPTPRGTIRKHCDDMEGWVLLFSLGCKPNFYVSGNPNANSLGLTFDNKKTFQELIDFNSGSVLIFDSSPHAAVYHEIRSIQANTCPKLLGDKRSRLKNVRVSLQFRIVEG